MTSGISRRGFMSLTGAAAAGAAVASTVQAKANAQESATPATVVVAESPSGVSVEDIGVVGLTTHRFDISDLVDLGVTNYRLYAPVQTWEPTDDNGTYGSPSIDEIKANANVINWAAWEQALTSPPPAGYQTSWSKMFQELRQANIAPVIGLDLEGTPAWAAGMNPPTTEADRNEWWEHVFATVYLLNVRHDFGVHRWQVLNEPNIGTSGWAGTIDEYVDFVRLTHDAIDFVYRRYLPDRQYHIHAPVVGLSRNIVFPDNPGFQYISASLEGAGVAFDTVDHHDYTGDVSKYDRLVHQLMADAGYATRDQWVSEFNESILSRDPQLNTKVSTGINIIQNLMRFSWPDDYYVRGCNLMSLYTNPDNQLPRLIEADGTRNPTYYAFRMAIRALQGAKPTHQTTSSSSDLLAITTKPFRGPMRLLVANQSADQSYDVDADVSRLRADGFAKLWEFSEQSQDAVVGHLRVRNGHATFAIPANAAVLLQVD